MEHDFAGQRNRTNRICPELLEFGFRDWIYRIKRIRGPTIEGQCDIGSHSSCPNPAFDFSPGVYACFAFTHRLEGFSNTALIGQMECPVGRGVLRERPGLLDQLLGKP